MHTGGTSSNTATIYKGKNEEFLNAYEYFNHVIGIYSGKSRIVFLSHDANKMKKTKYHKEIVREPLRNTYYINFYAMDESKLNGLYNLCMDIKPKIVWEITSPVFNFARYVEEKNKKLHPFDLGIAGGETLLENTRKTIERVYQAPLYDIYCSTECGNVATQCKEKKGLHYVPALYYIEFLDENLNHVKENEIGEMYISVLNSRYFLLLRYKTSDFASYTNKLCSCGRTFPIISKVIGRYITTLRSPNLSIVGAIALEKVLNEFPIIKDFQAFQNDLVSFTLNLITDGNVLSEVQVKKIKRVLSDLLLYNMNISIKYVNQLIVGNNGKVMHIHSKV